MNIVKKLPGPLLVFMGAVCLSFGGLIVKSFEGANLWQILFWRQTFFAIIVALYLVITYKKKYPNTAKKIVSVVIIKFVFATVVVYMENT